MADLYLGIETGGTKVVAGVARFTDGRPSLVGPEIVVPTLQPDQTLDAVFAGVAGIAPLSGIIGMGIGSFGPVDLSEGRMLTTPKPGWSGFPLADALRSRLPVPLGFDTDVNAAALAEHRWGAAQGVEVAVYITVGTGIGGGLVVNGVPVHGLLHPEMGHVLVPRRTGDDFEGTCEVHGACMEGMAAGPSIQRRWGMPGESLPDDHPAWDMAAWYLGVGMTQVTLALSPQVIVMGGGVMQRVPLEAVSRHLQATLDGYVPAPPVVAPHAARPGLLGAFALAAEAARP
ncbi:MAG: ROK family protein [Acidimicrobiia bacterium]|nr:ROK family protein [Acidimicrobiia bacterium]